jgi:hypothetical protein
LTQESVTPAANDWTTVTLPVPPTTHYSSTGTIVRQDGMDGYYIIRFDEPALVYDVPDTGEEISEVVEAIDNPQVMQPDG